MEKEKISFSTVPEYIAAQPASVQKQLKKMRSLVKKFAPQATECISYQMPAIQQEGIVLWYAGYAKHIGLYIYPAGVNHFRNELGAYKLAKSGIQFPLAEPLPEDLIERIVKFRLQDNEAKALAKKEAKANKKTKTK